MFYGARALARRDTIEERVRFRGGETIFLSVRAQQRLARGAERPDFDLRSDFIAPLEQLRAAADSDGARFVVVLLPSKEEIYGADAYPAVLNAVRDVHASLGAANLPVLDLYDVFRERGKERPLFFKRDIHFSAYGNAVAAEALDRWIAGTPVTARAPRVQRLTRLERRAGD
jgi:hypothetical protein